MSGSSAKAKGFVILSTDSDFYELATTMGPPPRLYGFGVGHTRLGMPNMSSVAIRDTEFADHPELGVLVLDRD
jgi:hypothetical protein